MKSPKSEMRSPKEIRIPKSKGGVQVVGLTKAQMAAALQISVRCLDGMMFRKEIGFWRIGKRVVRFRIEDAVRRMNETVLVPTRNGREQ